MYARNNQKYARVAPRTVTLLDPVYRCGLLEVPLEKTVSTKGRDEWLDGRLTKDLSLCCLFQKGRCHAQDRCFQVHVDRDYITALREQQSRIVSCCRHCNDTASLSQQAMNFFSLNIPTSTNVNVVYNNGATRTIASDAIAYTAGLLQQFEEHGARVESGVLVIPARRICRLHMRGCCKYGKDCKNVHACSKLSEKFLDAPNPTIVAPMMAPRVAPVAAPVVAVMVAPVAVAAKSQPVSPPMPSFAPVTAVPQSIAIRSNPLGGAFGIFDRNAVSLSVKSLDAADFCENSQRMKKSFLFDAAIALEDSALTAGKDSSLLGDSSNASSLMMAMSPGQKRRTHALQLDAMHPCSRTKDYMTACRISHWDQWDAISMFA